MDLPAGATILGRLLALPPNNIPVWRGLLGTNNLAYFFPSSAMKRQMLPCGIGSLPYSQTLDQAGEACREKQSSLFCSFVIDKEERSFFNIDSWLRIEKLQSVK